jgi:hypothetical protein
VKSEELELSLRTEFESYLKNFLADMRQEVTEFRKNFETEFEKHKSQTDEALRLLVDRFERDIEFDKAFNESVVEHLRLARDEGATVTAIAMGEAEKLSAEAPAAAEPEYDKVRDAINEISSKSSQSDILRSLVDHAANFAPRGAFFIVKNEHFVGWRGFGPENSADDEAVRSVRFPVSADTILAQAVNTSSAVAATAGTHADDHMFLEPIEFGMADRMFAIPLVARGRGVAVLYADYGTEGLALNPEALEALVRVAGLTVELAAAGVQPSPAPEPARFAAPAPAPHEERVPEIESSRQEEMETQGFQEGQASYDLQPVETAPANAWAEEYQAPAEESSEAPEQQEYNEYQAPAFEQVSEPGSFEQESDSAPQLPASEAAAAPQLEAAAVHESSPAIEFEKPYAKPAEEIPAHEPFGSPTSGFEFSTVEPVQQNFETATEAPAHMHQQYAEPAVPAFTPAAAQPSAQAPVEASRARFRDRNMELPIEVPEDERRDHNDARRFARLLVSEIKLYNEQKVADGRQAGDLYERLREAIDRSREMYEKRVKPAVADKFDYFHFELVNTLAEGEDVKLGAGYPGSKVAAQA